MEKDFRSKADGELTRYLILDKMVSYVMAVIAYLLLRPWPSPLGDVGLVLTFSNHYSSTRTIRMLYELFDVPRSRRTLSE